jgi:predicted Zn-dependent protease
MAFAVRQRRIFVALIFFFLAGEVCRLPAQSVEVDKKIGAQAAEQVVRTKGLYEKPDLQRFFEQLGKRLVAGLGDQPFVYHFNVSDEIAPNAFALPGGFVFATRGIFAVANSEDEVAGVIAHEIIHSHRRHSVQASKRAVLPGILAMPGGVVGIFNQEAGKVLAAPSSMAMARHSRKQEAEADDLGVKLAARSGYDPRALKACLNRLSKTIELLTSEKEKFSYFDDHPLTEKRSAEIEKVASTVETAKTPPILPGKAGFLNILDGLTLGRNPEQGVFDKNVFVHPDLNFRMELPAGWKTFNTPLAFGAVDPKGKGQMVVGLVGDAADAQKEALATLAVIDLKGGLKPAEARRVEVNGHPGYYALFSEKRANLHLLWLGMGGKVFRMAAAGEEKWREAMRQAVFSLRPLNPEERAQVRILRMRVESARAGESLDALSKRAGNAFDPVLTSMLNDLDGKPLQAGQLIKIARWEPYPGGR